MRSRLTHILMLTAWLLATGSHWDVLQMFAWGRMLANNARVLPIRDALEFTFSPEGRCRLCQAVQENRPGTTGDEGAILNLVTKDPVVFQTLCRVFVAPPTCMRWEFREMGWSTRESPAPPTPPPRAVA